MRVFTDWELTPERVAVHMPTATAVLADVHLGYGEARRRHGEAVPLRTVGEALAPLASVLQRWSLRRAVVAGDLFEDGVDEGAATELLEWFGERGCELAVLPGNHDRGLTAANAISTLTEGFTLGDWHVVHGDGSLPRGRVVLGHYHPAVRLAGQVRPCYLVSGQRLVLPAYSADARGGVPAPWRGCRRLVPVGDAVLDFGHVEC
jgi:putative SbcD/Mre11-related phosphoesterase